MDTNTTVEQIVNSQYQKIMISSIVRSTVTPKKSLLDEIQKFRQLKSPKLSDIDTDINVDNLQILKDRFLITDNGNLSSSSLNCIDIFTNEYFTCKVINEPFDKVMLAYFRLNNTTTEHCFSEFDEGHNHLVRPVHDIIPQAADSTYLIIHQPKIQFGNLHSYVRDHKRLEETEARSLFHQICKTVEICHQNGIILRDLKLRKFFFTDSERTKLQYESLEGAVLLDDSKDDTLTEKIGCPLYVSPELITPNSSYGGQAADMWALGVILYTILVGQYPFSDGQGQTLFTKISNCDFFLPPGLSSKARCLIRSLLRKNPEERLNASDVLFHPWFNDTKSEFLSSSEAKYDQCVPEYNDFDMT